ncbi:UNVERIFIED_ORG: hypothetical protein ABIC54_006665 [Burkholderia sp. 1263]|jgi:hypothetical protein|nr:hypothetical protein [Paraburkholderia terricola]
MCAEEGNTGETFQGNSIVDAVYRVIGKALDDVVQIGFGIDTIQSMATGRSARAPHSDHEPS